MLVIRQPLPAQHLAGAERRGAVRMLRTGNLQKPDKRPFIYGRALRLIRGPCPHMGRGEIV
jgi:hypothetical protein